MEIIYYKVHIEWGKYPFQDEVESKYVRFYKKSNSKGGNKFRLIPNLEMESNTSIEEKKKYLMGELNTRRVKVIKIK